MRFTFRREAVWLAVLSLVPPLLALLLVVMTRLFGEYASD